jgi:4-carboxymuconolactone decarboxylase
MTDFAVRIPPVAIEDFTAEQARLVGEWKHLLFSRVLANNPRMYGGFVPHLAELVARSELPTRGRQIVCLRMLELCGDVYEKTHHIVISRKAGMTDDEITAVIKGDGSNLSAPERAVLGATEQLHCDQFIDDATWSTLDESYSREQLMELVFLAGAYLTMAMVTKTFGIQLEPDVHSFNAIRSYT